VPWRRASRGGRSRALACWRTRSGTIGAAAAVRTKLAARAAFFRERRLTMGELAIAIPEPIAEDPENVVTALETAALFGARGDAPEALRWVRQAATSAGESGCDSRALDLARAAADLTPSPAEVAPRPRTLPVPPSRPSSRAPVEVDRAGATAVRPPPPSSSTPRERTSLPPLGSGPSTIRSEAPRAEAERSMSSVAPRASQAPRPRPAASGSVQIAPRAAASPRESRNAESLAGGRNAARVSVTPGPDAGLFLVRVLADGAAPPAESWEAYLVLADPKAQLQTES
jgi:hypothetical protein